jgi:ketosteroid isomerase-like protein
MPIPSAALFIAVATVPAFLAGRPTPETRGTAVTVLWRPASPASIQGSRTMSVDDNKALVRRYIEVGWSRGDLGVVRESVVSGYHRHQPGMPFPVETGAALEGLVGMYRQGLPDLEVVIDHIVGEGDFVATRVSAQGTHKGDLAGIAPTGKRVEFTASDLFKLTDGRIVESWHNVDDFGLLQQLGVIPAT